MYTVLRRLVESCNPNDDKDLVHMRMIMIALDAHDEQYSLKLLQSVVLKNVTEDENEQGMHFYTAVTFDWMNVKRCKIKKFIFPYI